MTEEVKLHLALMQVNNVLSLIQGNQYELYMKGRTEHGRNCQNISNLNAVAVSLCTGILEDISKKFNKKTHEL